MSILAGTLRAGRRQAESRMSETVTVGSVVVTVNPDTLAPVETVTSHYPSDVFVDEFADMFGEGRARVKYPSLTVSEFAAVGQALAEQDVTLHLPVGLASLVAVDDIVTVTGSTVDPDLIGRKFRIKGSAQAGQVTAHRFPVEEVS